MGLPLCIRMVWHGLKGARTLKGKDILYIEKKRRFARDTNPFLSNKQLLALYMYPFIDCLDSTPEKHFLIE